MTDKQEIEKLKKKLKKGDQTAIAALVGLHPTTVNRFFNGEADLIAEQSALDILKATETILKKREALKKTSNKIINRLKK